MSIEETNAPFLIGPSYYTDRRLAGGHVFTSLLRRRGNEPGLLSFSTSAMKPNQQHSPSRLSVTVSCASGTVSNSAIWLLQSTVPLTQRREQKGAKPGS